MPSTKSSERQVERGRARERDRDRRIDVNKHRSRDRDEPAKLVKKRHGSSSPGRKARPSLLTSSSKEGGKSLLSRQKVDRVPTDTRKIPSLMSTKLRMDEGMIRREREHRESFGSRKPAVELDRAVKRAREEQDRSSYWNRRVLEAEEKDPNRWGHSGFKELYSRDLKPAGRAKSRSPVGLGGKNARSPIRQKRQAPKRSRSRSLPRNQPVHRQDRRRSRSTSLTTRNSNFTPLGKRPSSRMLSRESPMLRRLSPGIRKMDRDRNSRPDMRGPVSKSQPSASYDSRLGAKRDVHDRNRGRESRTDRRIEERPRLLGKSDRLGQVVRRRTPRSKSRSVSTSSMSPRPKKKRTSGSSLSASEMKSRKRSLDSKSRSSRRASDSSSSRSRSASSSSNSSKDNDVLEIHADGRKRGRGSSLSTSSSSDDDSKSDSSSSSRATRGNRPKASDSSSSSSSSSSDSDDDGSDISGRLNVDSRKKAASAGAEKAMTAQTDKSKTKAPEASEGRSAAVKRAAPAAASSSGKVSKRAPPKTLQGQPAGGKSKTDDASSKGDSDSDSGSSSDSDSEPRMTLSERFAKLTQMSTDKREFAKPLLSANEIDTKLKVVKDLRNADTKVFVEGMQASQSQNHRNNPSPPSRVEAKPRTRSPAYNYSDGEKHYSSDERRRYFERMERDEPQVRPEDWSDARVRYEYYRDRGCFNDRPLTFEEYVKWEQWYYQYRDWLQNEGYYPRVINQSGSRGGYSEASRGSHMGDWNQSNMGPPRSRAGPMGSSGRRVEQVRLAPLSSRPHFLGRTDAQGRSIDRAPGGSLIVNIRQGGNYGGPRGRQVGIVRSRNNR